MADEELKVEEGNKVEEGKKEEQETREEMQKEQKEQEKEQKEREKEQKEQEKEQKEQEKEQKEQEKEKKEKQEEDEKLEEEEEEEIELKDQVISIRRVTKVVKGGKNLSFSALAAVGSGNGLVGIGKGKAREVPQAIRKAVEDAKKKLIKVILADTTIPHFIKGEAGGGVVILRPASKGTGVIAGGAVRVIMELAGIKDILTKSIRSNNPVSVANATMDALKKLRNPEEVSEKRGKTKEMIWQ